MVCGWLGGLGWVSTPVQNMERFTVRKRLDNWAARGIEAALVLLVACTVGCQPASRSPKVIFLDGAGHFGANHSVRWGLERAGYIGAFETFAWSSWLGPGADHLVVARSKGKARQLADRIIEARREYPKGKIYLMGLSAGTALIISALERLPENIWVDGVVLFSSSASAERNLSRALERVRGRFYATCSQHDGILTSLAVNADGGSGPPAGLRGFVVPMKLSRQEMAQYNKVVNLPWKSPYIRFGWRGGHVKATTRGFVQRVIAPRILSTEPYPLDRPLIARPSATGGRANGLGSTGRPQPDGRPTVSARPLRIR